MSYPPAVDKNRYYLLCVRLTYFFHNQNKVQNDNKQFSFHNYVSPYNFGIHRTRSVRLLPYTLVVRLKYKPCMMIDSKFIHRSILHIYYFL